jgi:NAD-dependent dihydropyrimidine dehydrogenase PreA subunit
MVHPALSGAARRGHDRGEERSAAEARPVTYVIAQPCVDTMELSCVAVCPVDCIHYEPGVDRMLYIDPNECIDCGACEPECSVAAIFPEESLAPDQVPFTAVNATWYSDRAAARAMVDALVPA